MTRSGAVHIGTSGWHFKHWRGPFYPEKFPASRMLEFYIQHFDTVELNNTFYRLPLEPALDSWRKGTPAKFRFAVKASRFLTHMKKLKDPAVGIENFFSRVDLLGAKFGPVIFQLPPRWGADPERLDAFLGALPARRRYAFEFRDPSWHAGEVYRILRRHRAAFCIYEIAGFFSGIQITANFTYIRLHGPGAAYQGNYSEEALAGWATRIREWRQSLRAVYLYFDNDEAGYAPRNALTLKRML